MISADNSAEVSRTFAPNAPPAPDMGDMIAALREKLREKAALRDLEDFEDLVRNPPPGFRLAPVYYVPVEGKKNGRAAAAFAEYNATVRRRTLVHRATHHADELRALGICDYGIGQMLLGKEPVSRDGLAWDVELDHVVEQAGAGRLAIEKAKDPALPDGDPDRLLVNHQDNIMVVPGPLHRRKTRLLKAQVPPRATAPRWVLSLVRVVDAEHGGYVAPPQPGGLPFREHHPLRCIRRIGPLRALAEENIQALQDDGVAKNALALCREIAHRRGRTAAALASGGLSALFNGIAEAHAPEAKALADNGLRPALSLLASHLTHAFGEAAASGGALLKGFAAAYRTRAMRSLRMRVDGLPFIEAAEMLAALAAIDARMEVLDAARRRPGQVKNQAVRQFHYEYLFSAAGKKV